MFVVAVAGAGQDGCSSRLVAVVGGWAAAGAAAAGLCGAREREKTGRVGRRIRLSPAATGHLDRPGSEIRIGVLRDICTPVSRRQHGQETRWDLMARDARGGTCERSCMDGRASTGDSCYSLSGTSADSAQRL